MAEDLDRLRTAYEERVRLLQAGLERRDRELMILSEVAARIHGQEKEPAILDIALEEILKRIGLGTAWIFMGDEKVQQLHLAASRGVSPAYLEEIRTQGLGECLCPEVFWSGHSMQARNTTECPRMPHIVEGLSAPVAHACIPLRFEGPTRGVLNVAARPGEQFSDDELRFLETLGHQVCIAVERARHLHAERLRNQEARALAAITKAIGGSLDVAAVLRAVARAAEELLGADQVYIFLGSDPRQVNVGHVSGSPRADLEAGQPVDLEALGWSLSVQALIGRQLVRVDDRDTDERINRREAVRLGVGAAIATPLLARDKALGVLVMTRGAAHRWSDEEVDLAEALAAQAAVALENARLYEEARAAYEAERRRNQEARALAAIDKAIGGSLDVASVLKAVGGTAGEIVGADRVQILLGADPRRLTVAHLSGLPHPELREGQALDLVALRANLQMKALKERRLFRIDDSTSDPRVNSDLARRWDAGSGIVVPLVARSQTLGVMALMRAAPHRWTEEQVDVAEALGAQASIALENARLYEDARRAYEELKAAQARIIQSEKMAVLGTFASGLAHEVRNPLNSIALQLSLLERRAAQLETAVAGQVRDLIDVIREEIKRLDNLVSDFLLFSRSAKIQYQPVSLDALMDDVARLLRPEARAAGVTLRRERRGEATPPLPVDAERIKQVIINLVRNAIEAMPGGGVVAVEDGMVDGRVCLTVRDNGPGLPEGLDVFQLFVTTKPRGTGLGLSIAQQIVVEHGGEITVSSEKGRGASFSIWLPPAPPEEAVAGGSQS